jgi:shikimate dehydrogenase
VTGWPIDHTLSPAMHNAAYEAMGLNAVYVPLPVRNEQELARLTSAIRVLPFIGLNVTMPFKEAILPMCDEVAALARLAGAVNTVHCTEGRLIGYNTDGRGLLESLETGAGFSSAGTDVVILGAGGAASSALVAFVLGRAANIVVANRNLERAEQLIARVADHLRDTRAIAVPLDEAEEAVREANLVINATPVGMHGDEPPPVPASWLKPEQVVADMVYRQGVTALLREARGIGAKTVDGVGMLVSQGAMAIDIWAGDEDRRAPRDVMRAAAEAALAADTTEETKE